MSGASGPKPSVDPVRWQPPPVKPLPQFGPAELTVVPMPGDAPEDIVVDADGALWTGLVDGRIVRIENSSAAPVEITEARIAPADALAVSIANPKLAPRQATSAYVVTRKQGS